MYSASPIGLLPYGATDTAEITGIFLSAATATSPSYGNVNFSVDTNTDEGTWFWVITDSATAPTEAQIEAGQDHTGSAAEDSGSNAVTTTGTQSDSATGLSSGTWYVHSVQEGAGTGAEYSNVVTASFLILLPYASIAYDAVFNVSNSECTFEIVATSETIGTGESVLVTNVTSGSPADYSFRLVRDGATLELSLSSDGATWDIANAIDVGTITTSKFYFTWERVGNEIITFLDGEETNRIYTAASIYDPENDLYIGAFDDDTSPWFGSVQAFRWRIGGYRYGSDHVATATPFADSDSYGTQTVYSENRALWWGDFASSSLYGPGATIDGLSAAALWCAEDLDVTPAVDRAVGGGMIIPSARRVESWLDLLAEQANCVWYPEGSNLRIQPDQRSGADNPSGLDIVGNGDFDTSTGWTEGTGWTIGSGVATATAGTASSLTKSLTTEDAVQYAVSVTCDSVTAGSFTVEFNGTEIISAQTTAGTYTALVTASGTSNDVEVVKDATFAGVLDDVTVKRSYYKETKWIRDSLNVTGPSERDAPTSVKLQWTQPSDTSPNWQSKTAIRTLPEASEGNVPLIETNMNLPAIQTESQALNKAVSRLQRNYQKVEKSWVTTDTGFIHRVGDAIQPVNERRGVSRPVWVESVDMVGYGRHRVNGVLYADAHFPDGIEYAVYQSDAYLQALIETEAASIWILDDDTDTDADNYQATEKLFPSGSNHNVGQSSLLDDGRSAWRIGGSASQLKWVESSHGGSIGTPSGGFSASVLTNYYNTDNANFRRLLQVASGNPSPPEPAIDVSQDTAQVIVFGLGGSYTFSSVIPNDGETHCYAFNVDSWDAGGSITFYVDWVAVGAQALTSTTATAPTEFDEFILGDQNVSQTFQYAALHDTPLTESDVAILRDGFLRNFEDYQV